MKSTSKAEASARDLKEMLELRGLAVAESKDAQGWPKLVIGANEASIRIESFDAVSKDIFGNDLKAFAPHSCELAAIDAMSKQDYAKILTEVVKYAFEKKIVKSGATLAAAEATAGEELIYDVRWPTKGA